MVRNPVKITQEITGPVFRGRVKTDDGEKTDATYLLKGGRDEPLNGNLDGGEERMIRVAFLLPKTAKVTELTIMEEGKRSFVYKVADK
jgi:hypothetical protein